MEMKKPSFILSCESTADLPYSYAYARNIPVLFYSYNVDGVDYEDDMGRDPAALQAFYAMLADGKFPTTSQLNVGQYLDFFRPLLEKGDVLHIAFDTGLTQSYYNAVAAAEQLKEEFPERTLRVVDSLTVSCGYGMLVDYAADLRDAGHSLKRVEAWVMRFRTRIHHQFFSTDLRYYRRCGRLTGPMAAVATVLGICPLIRLNDRGQMVAYSKARSPKAAIKATVGEMEKLAKGGKKYSGKCYICHSNAGELAWELRDAVQKKFKNLKGEIPIYEIDTVIASHCGPGTAAVLFLGEEREP